MIYIHLINDALQRVLNDSEKPLKEDPTIEEEIRVERAHKEIRRFQKLFKQIMEFSQNEKKTVEVKNNGRNGDGQQQQSESLGSSGGKTEEPTEQQRAGKGWLSKIK